MDAPEMEKTAGIVARPRPSSKSGAGFIYASCRGLGVIALLVFLLFFGCSPKSKQNPSNAEKEKVGHEISVENQAAKIINNFTLTETEGIRKIWVLDAESAIDTENLLKLKNLRVKFYEDNAITFLKSSSGIYNKKTQAIKAEGKVVLKTKTKEIVTYDVVWDPVVKKFMSDSELTIKTEGGTIRGKGMEASMDLSVIKIKQRITGKLEEGK